MDKSPLDKLTIEECEKFLEGWPQSFNDSVWPLRLSKQLADTMRENERLRLLVQDLSSQVIKLGVGLVDLSQNVRTLGGVMKEFLQTNKDS